MNDRRFLDALRAKTLQITLAEGIRMKVEIEYRETYEGGNWIPVSGSHRIVAVLDPLPPAPSSSLFSDSPKK